MQDRGAHEDDRGIVAEPLERDRRPVAGSDLLHANFFLPQVRLMEKTRDGARVRRRHDAPKTLYRRVLDTEERTY